MTEVEVHLTRDLRKMIKTVARSSHVSIDEAMHLAFEEGLRVLAERDVAQDDLQRKAGAFDEIARLSKRIQEIRQQLSSTDTSYARANFESFETFNSVGQLLMLYNVYRSDVQNLSRTALDRGIEVRIDSKLTDIPGIQELLDRYLFRRRKPEVTGSRSSVEGMDGGRRLR